VQPPVVLAERVAGERVERAERLVHQHDRRLGRERPGQADALAFAAGKLAGKPFAKLAVAETDQREQRLDPRRRPRVVPAEQLRRDADVLGDSHVREQADALEHVADLSPQCDRIRGLHVLAVDPHGAGARIGQAVDQPQQRGLAGTGRPDDGEEFALVHRERHAVEHGLRRVAIGDVVESDCWRGRAHAGWSISQSAIKSDKSCCNSGGALPLPE
jgi:hypothetical protein